MQATGNVHMHGGGTYDDYEAHADAVADKVVRGESALDFLIGPSPSSAAAAAPAAVRKHENPTIAKAPEVEEELSEEEHEEAAAEGAEQSEEDEEEAEGAKQDEGEAEGEKQAAAGHKTNGGTFVFTKYDAYDGDPGNDTKKSCGIDLTITFTPNEKLRSKKISFVQIMKAEKGGTPYLFPNEKPRATTAKDGDAGWAVDRVAGQKNADYQIGNDGKEVPGWGQIGHRKSKTNVRDATLEDTVRLPRDAGQTFKVQATSFTLDKSHGKYLGGVSWGYEVDAAGKVTKAAEAIQSMGAPGGIQKKALKRWNKQAKLKDKSKRNHKNQKKITIP
jgi:hypothetical protein